MLSIIALATAGLLVGSPAAAPVRATEPRAGIMDFVASVTGSEFKPCRTMFIAALGSPDASSGDGAEDWGIWRIDPGPPGVYLSEYDSQIAKRGGVAPSGWRFDPADWWVEEYGRIMDKPDFPIPPGRYIVTGDREVTTVLQIDESGGWKLAKGSLYDVTHLPCRAARYRGGSPANANLKDFPVTPGAVMPTIDKCDSKQDYAVVFVVGVEPGWK